MANNDFELTMYPTKGDMFSMHKEEHPFLIVDIGEENDLSVNDLLKNLQGTSEKPNHVVIDISHFHLDHYGGLDDFLEQYENYNIIVDSIVLPHEPNHVDEALESFFNKIVKKSTAVKVAEENKQLFKDSLTKADNALRQGERKEALNKIKRKCQKESFKQDYLSYCFYRMKGSKDSKQVEIIKENLVRILGEGEAERYIENFEKSLANEKIKNFKQQLENKIPFCYAKVDKDNELIIKISEDGVFKEVLAKDHLGFDSCKAYIPTTGELNRDNAGIETLANIHKENNFSVVLKIDVNRTKFAFLGDIEIAGLRTLTRQGLDLKDCDYIKDAHHSLLSGTLFTGEKDIYWYSPEHKTKFFSTASKAHNNNVQTVCERFSKYSENVKDDLITANGGLVKIDKKEFLLNSKQIRLEIEESGERKLYREQDSIAFEFYYNCRKRNIGKNEVVDLLRDMPSFDDLSYEKFEQFEKEYQRYVSLGKKPIKTFKSRNTNNIQTSYIKLSKERNCENTKSKFVSEEIGKTYEQKLQEEKDKIEELQNEVERNSYER